MEQSCLISSRCRLFLNFFENAFSVYLARSINSLLFFRGYYLSNVILLLIFMVPIGPSKSSRASLLLRPV